MKKKLHIITGDGLLSSNGLLQLRQHMHQLLNFQIVYVHFWSDCCSAASMVPLYFSCILLPAFIAAMKIHISAECKKALEEFGGWMFERRGIIEIKVSYPCYWCQHKFTVLAFTLFCCHIEAILEAAIFECDNIGGCFFMTKFTNCIRICQSFAHLQAQRIETCMCSSKWTFS